MSKKSKTSLGYHVRSIRQGKYGDITKVIEECEEYRDASEQGVKLMMLELADVYGALEAVAANMNLTMEDLRKMSDVTKRAFAVGHRVSKE